MTSKKKSLSKPRQKNRISVPMKKGTKIRIIVGIIVLAAVIALISVLLYLRKKEADRTVNIAFLGLSQEYTDIIRGEIPELEGINIVYSTLNKNDVDLGTVSQKFDMIFTWEGEITEALGSFSEDIPNKILQNIPRSLRDEKQKQKRFPILLDHYEMAFYTPLKEKYELTYPQNWDDFEAYLQEASSHVFSPFFCEGSNDRTLLALLGSVVEAKGGLDAYGKLIENLKTTETLDDVLDLPLDEKGLSVRGVLDTFCQWVKDGYTHPQWFVATKSDVDFFMADNQVAVIFESLIEHRSVAYSVIRNYDSQRVPANLYENDHGVVAPAIVCVFLSKNMNNDDILKNFATDEGQTRISLHSKLSPTQYRAESYDKQADDVRFWAASCKGGALPDVSFAVYQRKPEKQAQMANEIRQYLKSN